MKCCFFFVPVLWTLSSVSSFADPVPEFALPDVNANSLRYEQTVSPGDYKLQISAYYFGSAG